jgi:hypothetical protein
MVGVEGEGKETVLAEHAELVVPVVAETVVLGPKVVLTELRTPVAVGVELETPLAAAETKAEMAGQELLSFAIPSVRRPRHLEPQLAPLMVLPFRSQTSTKPTNGRERQQQTERFPSMITVWLP